MTYKESLTEAMEALAADPLVRFIGYGLLTGRAGGTLKNVPVAQIVETPVAENLMVGLAIGMSLRGLRPVVYIERMDFILNALDAIVNHLDKIGPMSRNEFQPAVILRVVVGNKNKPLYTGATHTQDFSKGLRAMVNFPVIALGRPKSDERPALCAPDSFIQIQYELAEQRQREYRSTMLVEYKDFL